MSTLLAIGLAALLLLAGCCTAQPAYLAHPGVECRISDRGTVICWRAGELP